MDPAAAARALTRWYARNARDLPWRRTHDPYRVLLVEFIMQQTRIEAGTKYYERFVARYPTIHHLAAASEDEVLAMWSGLGYYSRARRLHATARRIVDEFGGRVPDDPDVLRTLPGIGPYTAGAIASIAYDRCAPSIDGNQTRVIGRLLGVRDVESKSASRRIEAHARKLLEHASPRTVNQALMDLGSGVCLPRAPRCGTCPLAPGCATSGRAIRTRTKRSVKPNEDWEAVVHRRGDAVFLRPPLGRGLLGHAWLPPLRRLRPTRRKAAIEHAFSHKVWRVHLKAEARRPRGAGRWVTRKELASLPHASLTLAVLDAAARSK